MQFDNVGVVRQSAEPFYSLLLRGQKLADCYAFASAECGTESHENSPDSTRPTIPVAFVPSGLNTKEALELAALDAAIFRSASKETLERKINIVGKDGTVRSGVGRDMLRGLAKIQGLEHVIEEGVRPKEVICQACGKTVKVLSAGGIIPRICSEGCTRNCCDCDVVVSKSTARKAALSSKPVRCLKCASRAQSWTPERRAQSGEQGRKNLTARTPEQKAEASRKRLASMTPEQHARSARSANAALTREQRSEAARKRFAALTPNQRSELTRKASKAPRVCRACGEPGHYAKTCPKASAK